MSVKEKTNMYQVDILRKGSLMASLYEIDDYIDNKEEMKLILLRFDNNGEIEDSITIKYYKFSACNILDKNFSLVQIKGAYKR